MPSPDDAGPAASALADPARLHLLAETGLVEAAAAARIPTLDRVARLAARALGVPVAQVNLVSADEQIPAAAYVNTAWLGPDGVPLDEGDAAPGGGWRRPVGLDASYCQYVIERGTAVVIDDAASDPLVQDNRATREAGIGAYAAVPVVSPSGAVLGTVCAVDFTARAWTAQDVATLEECASLAGEEVAARLGAAALIREGEQRLRLAVQAARLGTWSLDLAEGVLTSSARCRADFGRAPDEPFAYEDLWAAVHPQDRARARVEFERAVATGGDYEAEYRVLLPDGRVRWIEAHGQALRDEGGTARRVVGLTQDVTERRTTEDERRALVAALQAERATLRAIVLQTPAPLALLVGPEHRFELVNDAYRRVSGGGRDVTGMTPREAFPELAGTGIHELFDQVYETGEPWDGVETLVRYDRDGTGVQDTWFNLRLEPLRDAAGRVWALFNFAVDVTDQVRARHDVERLLTDSERARGEAEAARDAAEGARARTERLQAVTAALARARTLDDVATVVVEDMVRALGARTGAIAGRAADGEALVLLRTAGVPASIAAGVQRQPLGARSPLTACFLSQAPIWIESREGPEGLDARFPSIGPRFDALGVGSAAFVPLAAAGEAVGVISFAFAGPRTFTTEERAFLLALGQQTALAVERARLFEAEHVARAEAEAANRAKSEFLAVMSHELRTPLNAIGGYAELIEMGIRGPVTPEQREDLGRIQASQRHLLGLINEVLNYARLETGTVQFDVEDVPLGEALAAAEALVAPQARAKGLTLTVAACQDGLAVRADAEKLRQIFVNLLSNAVKFTDAREGRPGRIRLSCTADDATVHVRVQDTGIGIPTEKLEAVFDPFVQVRSDLTRTAEGAGLGLAISRDLARHMGGDLTATSRLGEGSTFTLSLPRAADQR